MKNDFIITKISRIIFIGEHEYTDKTTVFKHDLPSNELIFNISGRSEVLFNGKKMLCEPDTVRFLPKGEVRQYIVNRELGGQCIDIYFDTDIPISNEAFVLKATNNTAIKSLFKKIFSVWVGKNEGYYFECMSMAYKILSELQSQKYVPEQQYSYIKPAIRYIEKNFLSEKITVADLTAVCGISDSYLKKLFIKKFGVPPIKYIIQIKINYACDLLQTGLYSLEQISELCGYESYYYFSRQFKSYIGISPTEFIKKYKSSK